MGRFGMHQMPICAWRRVYAKDGLARFNQLHWRVTSETWQVASKPYRNKLLRRVSRLHQCSCQLQVHFGRSRVQKGGDDGFLPLIKVWILNWDVKLGLLDTDINEGCEHQLVLQNGVKFLYTHLNTPSPQTKRLLETWQVDKLVETLAFPDRKLVKLYNTLTSSTLNLPVNKRTLNGMNVGIIVE